MNLEILTDNHKAQNKGARMYLIDPVSGEKMDGWFLVAGPDSEIQANARSAIAEQRTYPLGANWGPDDHEAQNIEFLARMVLDWNFKEKGEPVKCTLENVIRVFKAGRWIRAQFDEFAASRVPYFKGEFKRIEDVTIPPGWFPQEAAK